MNPCIVFDEQAKLHYLVRVFDKDTLAAAPLQNSASDKERIINALNTLLCAKSATKLICAFDSMPPVFPPHTNLGAELSSFAQARDVFPKRFFAPVAELLEEETYIESARPLLAHNAAPTQLIERWGSSGLEYLEALKMLNPAQCVLIAEPLTSCFFVRNTLCVFARLLCLLEDAAVNKKLLCSSAGFLAYAKHSCVLPFSYDFTQHALKPPFWAQLERFAHSQKKRLLIKNKAELSEAQDGFYFIPSKLLSSLDKHEVSKDARLKKKQLLYLLFKGTKPNTYAQEFINFITGALRADDVYGWIYDKAAEFECTSGPRFICASFASALVYGLVYHCPAYPLNTCAYCHNTFLGKAQGMPKRYCNDSCRVQASRAAKSSITHQTTQF